MSSGTATKRAKSPVPAESERNPQVSTPELRPDPTQNQELHDRIQQRAYQLYEERGGEPGRELEDWLLAEREVLGEQMDTDLG